MTDPIPDSTALSIGLLGRAEVRLPEPPLRPLHSRKWQGLLALLVLRHGSAVDRSWLAGMLWPESGESQARANLNKSLKDLRRVLDVENRRLSSPTARAVALDLAGARVDVLEFDAAIARGDEASLECAVALYRGPLLEGCREGWVSEARSPREQAYRAALERLATLASSQGDDTTAERYLRRLVMVDPLRESAQRALMAMLAAKGSCAAATQVYRELRALLHRELNAEPAPETRALFQRLCAEVQTPSTLPSCLRLTSAAPSPVAEVATPRMVPVFHTSLIGRAEEAECVRQWLARAWVVTLTGTGGVGKTRLAAHVAAEVVDDYADGVWFVSLAPLGETEQVPAAIAGALGIIAESHRSWTDGLVDFLRRRSLLLVLDNCEHLQAGVAELLETLRDGAPDLKVLATSRRRLDLPGEREIIVSCLPTPPPFASAEELRACAAVRLFTERVQTARPRFQITPANAEAVARLCAQLEGLPLAIELAAARARILTPEQISALLQQRFDLLVGRQRGNPRHRSLHAAMAWSYKLLAPGLQRFFVRLSAFRGGWTLQAAAVMLAPEPKRSASNQALLDALQELVECSLVIAEEAAGEMRYRMLETVREFAGTQLTAAEQDAARDWHAQYYLALSTDVAANAHGVAQSRRFDRLEIEHDNLRAALSWLIGRAPVAVGLQFAEAMFRFWKVRGYWTEGRERLSEILARCSSSERSQPGAASTPGTDPARRFPSVAPDVPLARARAFALLAELVDAQGDQAGAGQLQAQRLAIYRSRQDKAGIAAALHSLGVLAGREEHEHARELLLECLAIRRGLGDHSGAAEALGTLARVAFYHHDFATARSLQGESLEILRELGDRAGVAFALRCLGKVALQEPDLEAARSLFEESRSMEEELGNREGIAESLQRLAGVARILRNFRDARELYECAFSQYRELGDRRGMALALHNVAHDAEEENDLGGAWEAFSKSLTLRREIGDERGVAASTHNLAILAWTHGRFEQALTLLGESLAIWRRCDDVVGISLFLQSIAWLTTVFPWRPRLNAGEEDWPSDGPEAPVAEYPTPSTGENAEGRAHPNSDHRREERSNDLTLMHRLGARTIVALQLLGADQTWRTTRSLPPNLPKTELDIRHAAALTGLNSETIATAWAEGTSMSIDQAIALAIATLTPPAAPSSSG